MSMHIRDQLIEAQLWPGDDPDDPERDLAAAWRLSDHLRDLGWTMVLSNRVSSRQHEDGRILARAEYRVDLSHPQIKIDRSSNAVTAYGATAALAICRAASEVIPYLRKGENKAERRNARSGQEDHLGSNQRAPRRKADSAEKQVG